MKIVTEGDFNYDYYDFVSINSDNYFIHKKGGLVYKLVNDTIKRLDKSFNHLMQTSASLFTYKSKINRYGGYGFWSDRDFITYFDFDLLEWEVLSPENSKFFPIGSHDNLYQLTNDDVYFFNGTSINPNNRIKYYYYDKAWKYNFTSKKMEISRKH
ncbi:MAG TPA: hypothetical protein VIN72_12630 [Lutibacter sp.]